MHWWGSPASSALMRAFQMATLLATCLEHAGAGDAAHALRNDEAVDLEPL